MILNYCIMYKITNITKNQIKDLFLQGLEVETIPFETSIQHYSYWGKCENELAFLKRLYPLSDMPSYDTRFSNAEDDIYQHTVNNDDYPLCWVFDDDRFPLKNGSDEDYLNFLSEIFNPEICIEGDLMSKYLWRIQNLLCNDGYELYICRRISGKAVYSWRELSSKEVLSHKFQPFSIRYENELKIKQILIPTIPKKDRKRIFDLFNQYNDCYYCTTETGFQYLQNHIDDSWNTLTGYYTPKAFVDGKYEVTDSIENFIMDNYPQYVFDIIELFNYVDHNSRFETEVNLILSHYGYQLTDGKIQKYDELRIPIEQPQKDLTLRELIQNAESLLKNNSIQLALEKIWDAYERIKTFYGVGKDNEKKWTLSELEDKVSLGYSYIKEELDKEFKTLGVIGNNYQIRHFEKGKKEIPSDEMKIYFFNRCAALLDLCAKYINKNDSV